MEKHSNTRRLCPPRPGFGFDLLSCRRRAHEDEDVFVHDCFLRPWAWSQPAPGGAGDECLSFQASVLLALCVVSQLLCPATLLYLLQLVSLRQGRGDSQRRGKGSPRAAKVRLWISPTSWLFDGDRSQHQAEVPPLRPFLRRAVDRRRHLWH